MSGCDHRAPRGPSNLRASKDWTCLPFLNLLDPEGNANTRLKSEAVYCSSFLPTQQLKASLGYLNAIMCVAESLRKIYRVTQIAYSCIMSMYKMLFKLYGHAFGIIWLASVKIKQEIIRFSCQWLLWHRTFVFRVSFQRPVTFISLAGCLENEQTEPHS